jgi:hypothetical protein
MQKKDFFIGILLGLVGGFIGCFIALKIYTDLNFIDGFKMMQQGGLIGKVITLGAILNLILFFVLLKLNKDLIARGVIFAMFFLTILTLVL